MTSRILIGEDDVRVGSFLQRGLAAEGYAVETLRDGHQVLEAALKGEFALVVLDRMLPGLEGLEVCRRMREAGCPARVLMLTARDQLQDKIDGLKGGADDYMTKPFAFDELLARVEALLRRPDSPARQAIIEIQDLRVDVAARAAWRGSRRLSLTAREFALLACLVENVDTVVSRERLLSNVWGRNFDTGTKVVDVYVRYLRRKLEDGGDPPLIRTVRGFGYMISRTPQ